MTQKLTLLSPRLPVPPAPWEANDHLISKATVSWLIPNPLSHSTYCHPCPAGTKQHTTLPISLSEHPDASGCVSAVSQPTLGGAEISACGTGTLPQPRVSSATPPWTGLWSSLMSPCQCKPFTARTVRALGFTVTTRPQDLRFLGVRMFLLQHFRCRGPDAVGKAGGSRAVLGKATATKLPAEHRLHRHWEIFLKTQGTSIHHLTGAKEANFKSL